MDEIYRMLAYILILAATDVGRNEDSKIEMFSTNWWLISGLIITGLIIIDKFS